MADKDSAIATLEKDYVEFRDLITGLPDAAYREVWLGTWDLDRLLAHMAGWYREMAGAIARVGRGERPAPEGVDYGDTETFNAKFAAQAKDARAALDDWDDAFHQYYAAAKALPAESYGIDPERGRPRIGNRLLEGAGIGHFAEHRPQLETWLSTRA